jgi:hypothetical protein
METKRVTGKTQENSSNFLLKTKTSSTSLAVFLEFHDDSLPTFHLLFSAFSASTLGKANLFFSEIRQPKTSQAEKFQNRFDSIEFSDTISVIL